MIIQDLLTQDKKIWRPTDSYREVTDFELFSLSKKKMTIVIYPHGKDTLRIFLQLFNNQPNHIEFTKENKSNNSSSFCNVLVWALPYFRLGHFVHRKSKYTGIFMLNLTILLKKIQISNNTFKSISSEFLIFCIIPKFQIKRNEKYWTIWCIDLKNSSVIYI